MRITNKQIGFVFILQIVLSVIASITGSTWMTVNLDKATYLGFDESD